MQTLPPIRFTDAYKLAWVNFAKCTGRSRRSEFWFFGLANFLVLLLLGIIGAFLRELGTILPGIYILVICIPSLFQEFHLQLEDCMILENQGVLYY